ncbi:glycosyltransferase [Melittangium boletus]|uniref:Glycosyl transferase family 1 n=1 Tax=Melittangium boletus DSM 14713 TaxID=1294270 RepID=A0A286NUQ7_9BACT|nr:glycosyltransferase [Melittangium boletus]ATB26714.1 glycosyl transferase family 1 [Melittangium boletus DSM 14713]
MRREDARMAEAPLRMVQFTKSFYFGGTEVQVVELLRGLPSSYRVQVCVLDAVGPLMEPIRKMGITPEEFSLKGSLASPNTLTQVLRMARWLKQERVELVHVHDFYATVLAVPAAKLAGAKVIVGRLDLAHWHGKARRKLLQGLTHMADHVVGNAEAIRRMLIQEEGIPAEKISVIPNGLDLARFKQRMHEGLKAPLPDTGGAPVVVHVANMNHPVKRQEDLLRALATVRRAGPALHAFLVGDGPRRPELEALAGTLGVADRVHFLKHRADVPAIYAQADFGVLCSSAEGMSNAVMEGMAAGLPMVVTDVGGNPELVADGERGLVVPPLRPEALSQAFLTLLGDRELGRRMGAQARAFVERELSLTRLVRRHDELYRRVTRGG